MGRAYLSLLALLPLISDSADVTMVTERCNVVTVENQLEVGLV